MISLSIKLSKKFSLDLTLIHKVRSLKDGLTLLEFVIGGDWYKGDHNPKIDIHLILLNVTMVELNIYNINHKDK